MEHKATTMADTTPHPSHANTTEPFDIVSKYHSLLSADPDLTPPIAAIESLIALLTASPVTTISETLDLLSHSSATLRSSIPNWIALSAGTDLFQRYLIQTLNRPGALGSGGDFGHLRQHLLSNGRLFVQRAKKARAKIADEGRLFIREGSTILTNGGSRAVSALLVRAAELQSSGARFRVIYVVPSSFSSSLETPCKAEEGHSTIALLRSHSIPVACIAYSALAAALPLIDLVLVGAEGVVENGGIISRLGTHQIGLLARSAGKPMYVAAESYKFVRLYPLGMSDLPVRQNIIRFVPVDEEGALEEDVPAMIDRRKKDGVENEDTDADAMKQGKEITSLEEAVDFTPPNLISALITENGVLTPSAVSEELIKLWF